jgi:hypothetical protein
MQIGLTKSEILTLLYNVRTAVRDHPDLRGAFLRDVLLEEKLCVLIGQEPQLRGQYGVREHHKVKLVKKQNPEGTILMIGIGENHEATYVTKLLPDGTVLRGSAAVASSQSNSPETPENVRTDLEECASASPARQEGGHDRP